MAIPRLYDFTAGTLAIADQVDAEFANLISAIEGIGAAVAAADAYQQGVLLGSDWKYTALPGVVNPANGSTTWEAIGGAAWLPGLSGALTRTFTASAVQPAVKPPVLPGPGGFICVGVELTASGAGAVVSAVSGAEQVSAAAAIANPPAVSAGKVRVFDFVITKTGGNYVSSGVGRDRRPWALGARATAAPVGALSTASASNVFMDSAHLALRVECTGRPVRLVLRGSLTNTINGTEAGVGFARESEVLSGQIYGDFGTIPEPIVAEIEHTPPAGSHLFQPVWLTTAGTLALPFVAGATQFMVEEIRPAANDGTF